MVDIPKESWKDLIELWRDTDKFVAKHGLKKAISVLGEERVISTLISTLGAEEVVSLLDVDRIISALGEEKIIALLGGRENLLRKLIKRMNPEQRRQILEGNGDNE